jgi:hypothetical protein
MILKVFCVINDACWERCSVSINTGDAGMLRSKQMVFLHTIYT